MNWDPVDQTVLANEQVIDGRGWRSGAVVERRKIPQWFLRITDYAEELLDELDHIDWPEPVKIMQRNWIGRSEGTDIDFEIESTEEYGDQPPLRIFTTRPDTVYGATFMAVATEHPLAAKVAERRPDRRRVHRGVPSAAAVRRPSSRRWRSAACRSECARFNPFNGERLDVWVANFVLMGYGTGAVMSVPGHDERDHEFALRFGLPIRQVIAPADDTEVDIRTTAWTDKENAVVVNSGEYSGLGFRECFDRMADWLEETGRGVRRGQLPAPRLGGCRASATGAARSPSCTATPAAWCRCPTTSFRCCSRKTSTSRAAARRSPASPSSWRPRVRGAGRAHAGTPTPSTPSWNRRGTSRASPAPTPIPPSSTSAPTTGCRSTSTSGASSTPSCT